MCLSQQKGEGSKNKRIFGAFVQFPWLFLGSKLDFLCLHGLHLAALQQQKFRLAIAHSLLN